MNSKINTSRSFKYTALLLLAISISNFAIAQKRVPQNVRWVTITSQNVLDNGTRTDKSWVLYQEIYDSLRRLHTEVDWDFADHQMHKYVWHTFNGKQRVKTEIFENQKLQVIKEFRYNKDSLISQEIIKSVKPGDTSLYLTLKYSYNQQKKPIKIDARTENDKRAYTSMSKYDMWGTELNRKVRVKVGYAPPDSTLTMTSKPLYDSIGRLVRNLSTIVMVDKKKSVRDIKYTYDKNNNIVGISIRDEKGKLIGREERIFLKDRRNRLLEIKYYDTNDKLVRWLTYRYEIYHTSDRLNREIDY